MIKTNNRVFKNLDIELFRNANEEELQFAITEEEAWGWYIFNMKNGNLSCYKRYILSDNMIRLSSAKAQEAFFNMYNGLTEQQKKELEAMKKCLE